MQDIYTRTRITRARKPSPKPYTINTSSSFVPRMTHSLLDPSGDAGER
jgi:hypothetical protein